MTEIEGYEPRGDEVVSVDGLWLEAHFEGALPSPGRGIAVVLPDGEHLFASVREHLGRNTVRAMLLGEDERVEPGRSVRQCEEPVGIAPPASGELELSASLLVPESEVDEWVPFEIRKPEFARLQADYPAVRLGIEGIDTISPVARGGVALLVDASRRRRPFRRVADALADALEVAVVWVGSKSDEIPEWADLAVVGAADGPGEIVALRVAAALAAHRRDDGDDVCVVGRLPEISRTVASGDEVATAPGYGRLVDLLGAGLASTEDASVTTLLQLPIPRHRDDVVPIVETLDLGDVETQIFVDEEGRFAPDRSTSNAELSDPERERRRDALSRIRKARKAREKARLLGERELTEDERRAIDAVDSLRSPLT